MSKLFKSLWFWVILLHLLVVAAWYYLGKITPAPTYTEPAAKQDGSVGNQIRERGRPARINPSTLAQHTTQAF